MAAVALDSPGFPDSPFEQEDVIYPCKACGEILEEGKAYELAGNRWHIDCFRCNTCGTLLDSDANLLLLGDGSLICNNCTYSCSACGNKIEDLAILTGDQAFCSGCFRCRNCKRKIENLRYARTSQGIFCMSCHESLMARRRKKSKGTKTGSGSGTQREKALPSLPPGAPSQSAFSPELESPPVETPDAPSVQTPQDQPYISRKEVPTSKIQRDLSPFSEGGRSEGVTLPASTYGDNRASRADLGSEDGEEQGLLPMAFDPNPAPPPVTRKPAPSASGISSPGQNDGRPSRDYFNNRGPPKSSFRDVLREEARSRSPRSRSSDQDPEQSSHQAKNSSHILYQDKARHLRRDQSSNNILAAAGVGAAEANTSERPVRPPMQTVDSSSSLGSRNESFKLGDVPDSKKAISRTNSKAKATTSPTSPPESLLREGQGHRESPIAMGAEDSPQSSVNPYDDSRRRENVPSAPARNADRPVRGDSLTGPGRRPKQQGSPESSDPRGSGTSLHQSHGQTSTASIPSSFNEVQSNPSRDMSRSKVSADSPRGLSGYDTPPPPRSSSRPGAATKAITNDEPRPAPAPSPFQPGSQHKASRSVSSLDGRTTTPLGRSPALPKRSLDGTFSMEEEMGRIMRGEAKKDGQASEGASSIIRRKVSNAVKHGRSISDRGLSSAGKASANGAATPVSISSPIQSTFSGQENAESLAAQLRRAHQRITELETTNAALQEKVNSSSEIKAANNELREKRTTIVVLDTQREMVVRELEAMTEHLTAAKNSNQPLDINSLKGEVVKDFAESLQKLKDQMSFQIEDLMHKRNELTEEIGNLIQMKDKGFQEYESLSTKNAQLLEMNSQILQNIQEMYKSNRGANGASSNGLGIYQPGGGTAKAVVPSGAPSDLRNLNLISTDSSMPNLLQETDAESATVLNAPQVVNIRKAQPKRFNWRRGGEKMAKNVTKGIKGAFGKDEYGQGLPIPGIDPATGLAVRQGSDAGKPGAPFALFGPKGAATRPGLETLKSSGSSTNLAPDASVLFGSDLEARCDFEKRMIPAVVSRCIEEVEARGMEMEGIYRKSGGSGQVKQVQGGFEKDSAYDISDPDLDIHAVTSALKQYFRKLPTPLVTYDVYEPLLDAAKISDTDKQALALKAAIAELPESHRSCLEYLFQHLARVVLSQGVNLMTPLNLAVVFAPTIMRPLSIEREMSDMQMQRNAVQAMLEQHEVVFGDDE